MQKQSLAGEFNFKRDRRIIRRRIFFNYVLAKHISFLEFVIYNCQFTENIRFQWVLSEVLRSGAVLLRMKRNVVNLVGILHKVQRCIVRFLKREKDKRFEKIFCYIIKSHIFHLPLPFHSFLCIMNLIIVYTCFILSFENL